MEFAFEVEGAKRPPLDAPAQQPMRPDKLRRNPDADSKKARRQQARQRKTGAIIGSCSVCNRTIEAIDMGFQAPDGHFYCTAHIPDEHFPAYVDARAAEDDRWDQYRRGAKTAYYDEPFNYGDGKLPPPTVACPECGTLNDSELALDDEWMFTCSGCGALYGMRDDTGHTMVRQPGTNVPAMAMARKTADYLGDRYPGQSSRKWVVSITRSTANRAEYWGFETEAEAMALAEPILAQPYDTSAQWPHLPGDLVVVTDPTGKVVASNSSAYKTGRLALVMVSCPDCGGSGIQEGRDTFFGGGSEFDQPNPCGTCGGSGRVPDDQLEPEKYPTESDDDRYFVSEGSMDRAAYGPTVPVKCPNCKTTNEVTVKGNGKGGQTLRSYCPTCGWSQTKKHEGSASMNREAEILKAMAKASLPEQRRLAQELDQLRREEALHVQAARDVDLADSHIRDCLTPVMTHTMHTAATDWIGELTDAIGDAEPDGTMVNAMRTAATLWFNKTSAEVREDRDEFAEQAMGMARREAGVYGERAASARRAYLDHLAHLHRMAESGSDLNADPSGEGVSKLPHEVPLQGNERAFDEDFWADVDAEVPSDRAPVIQENKQGRRRQAGMSEDYHWYCPGMTKEQASASGGKAHQPYATDDEAEYDAHLENQHKQGRRVAGVTCPACGDSNYTNRMDGSKRCDSCGHEWDPNEGDSEEKKEAIRRAAMQYMALSQTCPICGQHQSMATQDDRARARSHYEDHVTMGEVKRSSRRTAADNTQFGVGGDHCPHCGADWKKPHDEDCPRITDPAWATAVEEEAMRDQGWETSGRGWTGSKTAGEVPPEFKEQQKSKGDGDGEGDDKPDWLEKKIKEGAADGSIFCNKCKGQGMVRAGGVVRNCSSCKGTGLKKGPARKTMQDTFGKDYQAAKTAQDEMGGMDYDEGLTHDEVTELESLRSAQPGFSAAFKFSEVTPWDTGEPSEEDPNVEDWDQEADSTGDSQDYGEFPGVKSYRHTASDPVADESGQGQSSLDDVEVGDEDDRPMWPWEIGENGQNKGSDASNVSGTATPPPYPQPKSSGRRQAGMTEKQICAECDDEIEKDDGGAWKHKSGDKDHAVYPMTQMVFKNDRYTSGRRVTAEDEDSGGGQTCSVCGDSIEKDPPGEDPQTWHHSNGEKHDHEAKPSGGESESKESRRRTAVDEAAIMGGSAYDFGREMAQSGEGMMQAFTTWRQVQGDLPDYERDEISRGFQEVAAEGNTDPNSGGIYRLMKKQQSFRNFAQANIGRL